MGNNCSSIKNKIDPKFGNSFYQSCEASEIRSDGHWCAITRDGDKFKHEFCQEVGAIGEWTYKGKGSTCYTPIDGGNASCDPGCCHGNCGIIGHGVICKRVGFLANEEGCCFSDYGGCQYLEESCFETANRRKTCAPDFRNLSGISCLEKIEDVCSGNKLLNRQNHWIDAWIPGTKIDVNPNEGSDEPREIEAPCLKAIVRALYDDASVCDFDKIKDIGLEPGILKSSEKFVWAERVVTKMFNRYVEEYGSPINSINTDGLRIIGGINMLYDLCNFAPGLCERSLKQMCATITAQELAEDPNTYIKWCGCYMPDVQYEKYTDLYQINKECTPFCSQEGAIPLVAEDKITKLYCQQNICIMDDITLRMFGNRYQGKAEFSQICPSCGTSNVLRKHENTTFTDSQFITPDLSEKAGKHNIGYQSSTTTTRQSINEIGINRCDCQMNNVSFNLVDSTFNNLKISQHCGNSNCTKQVTNDDGSVSTVQIPCAANNISEAAEITNRITTEENRQKKRKYKEWVNYAVIIVAVIVAMVFLWMFYGPNKVLNGIKTVVIPPMQALNLI